MCILKTVYAFDNVILYHFLSVFECADKKGVILTNLLKEFYLQSDNPFLDGLKFYARLHMGSTVKSNSIEFIGMFFFLTLVETKTKIHFPF